MPTDLLHMPPPCHLKEFGTQIHRRTVCADLAIFLKRGMYHCTLYPRASICLVYLCSRLYLFGENTIQFRRTDDTVHTSHILPCALRQSALHRSSRASLFRLLAVQRLGRAASFNEIPGWWSQHRCCCRCDLGGEPRWWGRRSWTSRQADMLGSLARRTGGF